jgi:hypothetical protein
MIILIHFMLTVINYYFSEQTKKIEIRVHMKRISEIGNAYEFLF